MKKSTTHVVNRSNFGYGDAPTVDDTSPLPEEMALGTLEFPKVIALFTGGTIHHPHNMPLELNDGGYQVDSGDLDIDEPIFKTIPGSRRGIKIHVFYRFKKMTAN